VQHYVPNVDEVYLEVNSDIYIEFDEAIKKQVSFTIKDHNRKVSGKNIKGNCIFSKYRCV